MGSELIGLAVAGVGVVGTFGVAVAAQWAALRGKRLDAEIQRGQRIEQHAELVEQQEHDRKQSVYSQFNAATRNYRMQLHHCVVQLEQGELVDGGQLDTDRADFREMYAQAQMILPDEVLALASEVDLCLGNTYRAVLHMIDHVDVDSLNNLHRWLDDSMSEAVWLLRQVLRADLGVAGRTTDLEAKVTALSLARVGQFDNRAGAAGCDLKGDVGSQ
ncbi:SET domain-containing protein [Nocardia tengchongensis]|uniref:hypothetical protein n=1 Tax=Nocardia tengchongensis TaxID=2055889 RepID=UPI0036566512